MNRNTELHFQNTPQINIKRSKFERSCNHKTSFNVGDIIPLYVDSDILPGDTVQMDMASLVRMATPIYPIMDNLFMDTYWFFVPHRLVWEHWKEFWGENDNPWVQETEYEIPQITAPSGGWTEGTIADYMGLPTKIGGISVSALPFRAYVKCWNDFFRDQNLKSAAHMYTDDTTRQGTNSGDYVLNAEKGAMPLKAAKFHDYFTSALPSAQKSNEPVRIPLGTFAPATGTASTTITGQGEKPVYTTLPRENNTGQGYPLYFKDATTGLTTSTNQMAMFSSWENVASYPSQTRALRLSNTNNPTAYGSNQIPNNLVSNVTGLTANTTINNLMVDLSSATAASINQLRTAFAIQKYYENAGLHGTRYIEYIRSVFGVTSSDARFQRAEYIGGKRQPINISQVLQTSSTDATSPQGNTAAFSLTINKDSVFTKSFEEHGTLLCLAVVRAEHTYQQGINKMWTRKKWLHFYNPFFAHLGEMPVEMREIYAQGNSTDLEIFGYQEAWAEYRYKPSYVSGYMRSNASGSLDVWHFADNYNSKPVLGTTWIDEPYTNVDRTIAVTSQLTHQFIGDFFFKTFYTRPMPVYSVPGLIDHV